MVLGVEPSRALHVAAECVDHHVVVPREVAVAGRTIVTPDIAALGVHHRLECPLNKTALVVPF